MNTPFTSYYLPGKTAELLHAERMKQCRNPSLVLHKYAPQASLQSTAQKNRWLHDFVSNAVIDTSLARHAYTRWLTMTTASAAQHFQGTTSWRLAIGLHNETVLETDLTLHPLYGLPLIPGSALKGLCRTYAIGEIIGHTSKKIIDDETDQRIFGSLEQSGTVIFFDALPFEGNTTFALDITNTHYPDYYSQGKAPANNQRPNPVMFLTVTDTLFAFALAPRNRRNQEHQNDVAIASRWLQEALQEYGVGGKTSAGYGYFTFR